MIQIKKYQEPQINTREILRYMGCKDSSEDTLALINTCLAELKGKLTYRVCYDSFDITLCDHSVHLGFVECVSRGLSTNLAGCEKAIVFAATVGIEIDRLIAKYSRLSPSKALCFQAIGAERIESLCDVFNEEISSELLGQGLHTRPRYSPGYGDLSLEVQRDIFMHLDCPRKIGLSLNESLLMSPSKSVTAIIGLSTLPTKCKSTGCKDCSKTDCDFRR